VAEINLPGGIAGSAVRSLHCRVTTLVVPSYLALSPSQPTVIANALHVAVQCGNAEAVQLLCEAGADVSRVSLAVSPRRQATGRVTCDAHALPVSWALYGPANRSAAVAASIVQTLSKRGAQTAHLVLEAAHSLTSVEGVAVAVVAAALAAGGAAGCNARQALTVAMRRAADGELARAALLWRSCCALAATCSRAWRASCDCWCGTRNALATLPCCTRCSAAPAVTRRW